jgi:hypothetical protein
MLSKVAKKSFVAASVGARPGLRPTQGATKIRASRQTLSSSRQNSIAGAKAILKQQFHSSGTQFIAENSIHGFTAFFSSVKLNPLSRSCTLEKCN